MIHCSAMTNDEMRDGEVNFFLSLVLLVFELTESDSPASSRKEHGSPSKNQSSRFNQEDK